jgi:hypothetical protein
MHEARPRVMLSKRAGERVGVRLVFHGHEVNCQVLNSISQF